MTQGDVRAKLTYVIENYGLKSKTICKNVGIPDSILSKFKHGHTDIYEDQLEKLNKYLDIFYKLVI